MLKEIGLASSLLGNVLDMFKADKKDKASEATGAEAFGSLMTGGMTVSDLPVAAATDSGDSAERIGTTDRMDDGTKEALDMLREMTSGGLEGAMRYAMKKLRESVMDSMGISEGDLAAMPADQRKAMEKTITDEVQKRLAEAMGKDRQTLTQAAVTPQEMVAGIRNALQFAANKAYKDDVPTV